MARQYLVDEELKRITADVKSGTAWAAAKTNLQNAVSSTTRGAIDLTWLDALQTFVTTQAAIADGTTRGLIFKGQLYRYDASDELWRAAKMLRDGVAWAAVKAAFPWVDDAVMEAMKATITTASTTTSAFTSVGLT